MMDNVKYSKKCFRLKRKIFNFFQQLKSILVTFYKKKCQKSLDYFKSILLKRIIIDQTKNFKCTSISMLISRNFRKILFQMASLPLTFTLWHIRRIYHIHFKPPFGKYGNSQNCILVKII